MNWRLQYPKFGNWIKHKKLTFKYWKIDWSDVFVRIYKAWNSTMLSTLIRSHSFDQLPACSSCEKVHFCLSRCSGIIFQLGINWLITKNSIFNSLNLYNFIHSNLKSLVRSVASSLLMWKSAFLSVFVSHAPLSESLTSKPVLKSDNLQYNTMERWIDGTIVPPSDGPMFILITAIVANPPERKLVKQTSVQYGTLRETPSLTWLCTRIFLMWTLLTQSHTA